ncbi:MAG: CNNM domain-containing protein [Phycisphaerales bacterium]
MSESAWIPGSLAIVGTLGAGFCAGAEMGIYSLSRVRLNLRARAGEASAKLLHRELEHPARLLAALLVGYNAFSYVAAMGITELLEGIGLGHWGVVVVTALVVSPLLFVLTDGFPKEAFRAEAEWLTYAAVRPVVALRVLLMFTGILPLMQWLARVVSSLLGGGGEAEIPDAREKMSQLLKEGAAHGVLSEAQVSLLDRAFLLREATVRDEMVPWDKVHKVSAEWNRARVLDAASQHTASRYPVVNARGGVVGVVELMALCLDDRATVKGSMTPPVVLEEEGSVRDALRRLRSAGAALAIVERRGRPVGIVTTKDLVEPLTGELKVF